MELLRPPAPLILSGNNLKQAFKDWKQKFLLYYSASGAETRLSSDQKKALLLHCIGDEALKIYNNLDGKEDLKFLEVINKFEEHCSPYSNETFNRHIFFSRKRKDGETLDQFFTEIKKLSLDCNFEHLRDGLVRDQIILGVNNIILKEKLLRINNLTLEKCISICKASEVAQEQIKEITESTSTILAINKRNQGSGRQSRVDTRNMNKYDNRGRHAQHASKSRERQSKCRKCDSYHQYRQCPAFNRRCAVCKKYGHFAKMCYNRNNCAILQDNQDSLSETSSVESNKNICIDTIWSVNSVLKDWLVNVEINKLKIKFKIDTGAQVNILNYEIVKQLGLNIRKSIVNLRNFDGSLINVEGITQCKLKYNSKQYDKEFYIVKFKTPCILGYQSAVDMGLIKIVNQIESETSYDTKNIMKMYKDLFQGLGVIDYVYKIKLSDNCVPIAERPRRIPFVLQSKVKNELDKMEKMGVIRKVTEPTEWVNSMVITKKSMNNIRICLDPQNLNKYIIRERCKIPTFEEVVANMPNAKYFSVLDASKGFYMIKLSKCSQLLTTFNAGQFGRYCYERLPFGLNSAPEVFSRCFSNLFLDIEGVEVYIDEIIVWGSTMLEHDKRLKQVLEKAKLSGLKFNKEKCQFGIREVKYVGHILSSEGIKPDPEKVRAIISMKEPSNKKELQTFLGIITYVTKFIPNLSDKSHSLRELLRKDSVFIWGDRQKTDFDKLKQTLITKPVLKYFDVNKEVVLSVDSSSTGLGAVLLQNSFPIAYASKALTDNQKSWAQIEKELLAIVYGCRKFHQYIYGRHVVVESDHKPLESIFKKSMSETPLRLQRLRLNLQEYDIEIRFKPGKDLLIADALSRCYVNDNICNKDIDEKVELHVCMIKNSLDMSQDMLNKFKKETENDKDFSLLKIYIKSAWPSFKKIPINLRFYHSIKDDLYIVDNLIFKNSALLVPKTLRKEMLNLIHYNHMGVEKSKNRIRGILFWPFINKEIEDLITNCDTCLRFQKSHSYEPLLLREFPKKPWQVVGADMFFCQNKTYLLVVDYFSKYIDIVELKDQSAENHIVALKTVFSRWGIPNVLYTDDGAQYRAQIFKDFCINWNFKHTSSSPYYNRSNGMVERHIQTIKKLFKKCISDCKDFHLALLELRNMPISNNINVSPNELLLGRQSKSILPIKKHRKRINYKEILDQLEERRVKYKCYHDTKNKGKMLKYYKNQNVYVRDKNSNKLVKGFILDIGDKPRTYKVLLDNGQIVLRNTFHIFKGSRDNFSSRWLDFDDDDELLDSGTPLPEPVQEPRHVHFSDQVQVHSYDNVQRSRSGRAIIRPERYNF